MEGNTTRPCSIGERIKECRENIHLTQQDLAKAVDVKRETVNQWENGHRLIKGPDVVSLSEALGVTCDYILTGTASENISVSTATGLSNVSIENLRKLSGWDTEEHPAHQEIVNTLIGSPLFGGFLDALENFEDYAALELQGEIELKRILKIYEVDKNADKLDRDSLIVIAAKYVKAKTLSEKDIALQDAAKRYLERMDRKNYMVFKLELWIRAFTERRDIQIREARHG